MCSSLKALGISLLLIVDSSLRELYISVQCLLHRSFLRALFIPIQCIVCSSLRALGTSLLLIVDSSLRALYISVQCIAASWFPEGAVYSNTMHCLYSSLRTLGTRCYLLLIVP